MKRWTIIIAVSLGCAALKSAAASLPDKVDFNYHIKPLLSDRCYACHGPDEKARKAKLRLDTKEGAFKPLEKGMFVVKPGDLAKSEVYRRITATDPDDHMPPLKSNLSLTRDEIELIRRWIKQGAEWKRHWSFIPVGEVKVPRTKDRKWPRNPIDYFVLARLENEGLKPAAEAGKERLIRRVTFDLTGLPPTLAEIDAFLADTSPDAYETVVDRLLASTAYGERMAVEWLDVARYADTYGYQADRFNHLWPWRDWVIGAFNRNLPFDQFILWQIAGDLLPDATREQKLATAFNRNHRQTNEGGSVDEEFRVEYNADRVQTTAGAFLGLTVECARCHDHKFDPITQKDYYRFFAFFNSTDESGLYSHFTDAIPSPTLLLFKDDAQEQQHHDLKRAIAAKEEELKVNRAEAKAGFDQWLKETKEIPPPRGLVGHYSFDEVISNKVANLAGTNSPGKLSESPRSVEGKSGKALLFSGENSVAIEKLADFKRTDPFSFSLWLNIPEELPEIVVLHHQQAGSDAAYQGYELVLQNGHAGFALVHFWPGNAIKVRTREKLPLRQWLHCGITYDGSSRAAGVKLYLNGRPAEVEVVKDRLFKDFANGVPLTLAARFRGRGFKDGMIDELQVFNRSLTPLEMAKAFGGSSRGNEALTEKSEIRNPKSEKDQRLLTSAATREELFNYYLANLDPVFTRRLAELKDLRDRENEFINGIKEIMVMGDLPTPRPTYVLKRGAYDARGDVVEPGTPESIFPLDPKLPRNRLGLAQWLVDPKNPLTARVIVNRCWQMFFGRGLVVTAEDFGSQGTLPTHPELLDWLAATFMSPRDLTSTDSLNGPLTRPPAFAKATADKSGTLSPSKGERGGVRGPIKASTREPIDLGILNPQPTGGWDLKALHKLVAMSATYRQSSQAGPELLGRDPDNKLLARGPKNRLTAEMLRDSALAAAGLLSKKIGGPSVKPYQPDGLWEEKSSGWKYEPDKGEGLYRRSLYTYWKRTSQHPMMTTFDAAERNTCVVRRQTTSTPLQALVLLNDTQFVEAARKVAERALKEGGGTEEGRLVFTFRLLTGRRPGIRELEVLKKLHQEQLELFRSDEKGTEDLAKVGESSRDSTLDRADLAASTVLANALLNFDEAVIKR